MNRNKIFYGAAKVLITNSSDKVLLLQSRVKDLNVATEPYWDLPGGRLQEGQNFEQALERELKEEIGIKRDQLTKLHFLSVVLSNRNALYNGQKIGLILAIYGAKAANDIAIMLSGEHLAYGWFDKKIAKKRLAFKYPPSFIKLI